MWIEFDCYWYFEVVFVFENVVDVYYFGVGFGIVFGIDYLEVIERDLR